jgi:hypothetical protein
LAPLFSAPDLRFVRIAGPSPQHAVHRLDPRCRRFRLCGEPRGDAGSSRAGARLRGTDRVDLGGGTAALRQRGQLLPRERLALLLGRRPPFLELATLAGLGLDTPDLERSVAGGGVVAGIGFVAGVRCMVAASDSGIEAGALQAMGLDKQLRIQELALENKLPFVQLVESAGANLMKYRVEDFIRGGNLFRNLARLSAAGCRSSRSRTARRPLAGPTRPASPTTS